MLVYLLAAAGGAYGADSLVNRPAPQFSLTDLHGDHVTLSQYRGKVVLLNFWATWCAPCRLEMPEFVAWQKRYGPEGLQVLGVSIDDDEAPVRVFAEKLHLNYPVVMGDAKLGELYGGVLGVPVTFLIDRKGMVRARFDGEPDPHTVESRVLQLLRAAQR